MSLQKRLEKWIWDFKDQIQRDYFEFLRFKSISADLSCKEEMLSCANWLKEYLKRFTTLKSRLLATLSAPVVFAEDLSCGGSTSTLLIYGHYDVQPVDPIELWRSNPFEPIEKDGKIFARGAVDNKGQIFYAITALRALKELKIDLPINLKLCIEGEEETASAGLLKELLNLKKTLRADSLLVIDFDQFDSSTPALSFGARGIYAFEVVLKGSYSDLHSGMHGGMAYNPNRALVELLAKVWNEKGQIQIDGFYDDVEEVSKEELAKLDFFYTKKSYQNEFGIKAFGGEKDRSLAENNGLRPTFEINGIFGGYTKEGFKTVIPAKAFAKVSCRLVPHQDPKKIAKLIEDFFKKHAASKMEIEIRQMGGERAFRGKTDSDLARAIQSASSKVCGKTCKNIVSGGSIPIIAQMSEILEAEVTGMGYGLPTDNIHAPNEHFDLERFKKGFLTVALALESLKNAKGC